jgi:hypothetical protein
MTAAGLLAIPAGALAGGAVRLLGRKGARPAALAGAVAAGAIALGFGFASRFPLGEEARARAAVVGRKEYDAFARAAGDWGRRPRGSDDGKFAQAWELLPGTALGSPAARVAEFRRTVVPELDAWQRGAPSFEEWRERRRAAILREAESPWSSFLASPLRFLGALDLLAALVGVAAAVRVAFVPAPPVIRRDSSSPRSAGPI